jgi:hypothetical protein
MLTFQKTYLNQTEMNAISEYHYESFPVQNIKIVQPNSTL